MQSPPVSRSRVPVPAPLSSTLLGDGGFQGQASWHVEGSAQGTLSSWPQPLSLLGTGLSPSILESLSPLSSGVPGFACPSSDSDLKGSSVLLGRGQGSLQADGRRGQDRGAGEQ